MRWRRLLLGLGALAVLGLLTFVVAAIFLPAGELTRKNHEQIQNGMTVEEVKGFLGDPEDFVEQPGSRDAHGRWLRGSDAMAHIHFREGRVYSMDFSNKGGDPTLVDRLRRLLSW